MAQLAHTGLLAARGVGGAAEGLLDSKFFLGVVFSIRVMLTCWRRRRFGVYVDGLCAALLVPWLCTSSSPSAGGKVPLAVDAVYAAEGLP